MKVCQIMPASRSERRAAHQAYCPSGRAAASAASFPGNSRRPAGYRAAPPESSAPADAFPDQRHQLTAGGFVDAGKRFVEHHQRRALHHHPRRACAETGRRRAPQSAFSPSLAAPPALWPRRYAGAPPPSPRSNDTCGQAPADDILHRERKLRLQRMPLPASR